MKQSAGILLFRRTGNETAFFLVHPGGPFWKNKDSGAWSIPKGEFNDGEDPLDAARREFREETGMICEGDFLPLSPVKLKSGKIIFAWALEQDIDAGIVRSNSFEMEWPPKSGKMKSFPEIDKAYWFLPGEARQKINAAQTALIDEVLLVTGHQ
jgi:predicted NUDIX family NTP pyrophosphohydrolase